jgi:hypothetical protein
LLTFKIVYSYLVRPLRHGWLWLLVLAAGGLCRAVPPPAVAVQSVRLEPAGIRLPGPGASQRFLLTATDVEGNEMDAGESCQVVSSDTAVVSVENSRQGEGRRVVGRAPGTAKLRVECAGHSTEFAVSVGEQTGEVQVNFARDVISILTTKGCNGSSCHGSPAGQNGFKLSLYGSDPEADRRMIVEAHDGRRVNLSDPEKSLILQKPSFQIAHGGGQLMTAESDEYQTILRWLSQGAAFSSEGARLESLEIYPRERVLIGSGQRQGIAVMGRLSDGTTRDMTGRVRFSTLDEAVVSAVQAEAVQSKSRGLTTVMARAMGKVATAQFIVIEERAGPDYPQLEANNFIDRHVFEKLREVNIRPFPVVSDQGFVRRVFLDAIGVLPTPEESKAFLSDTRPDKRERLIDALLGREEYTTQWLVKFEDWFRNSQFYSQGRTNGSYKRWLGELIHDDRAYDEAAREMLTATGDTTVLPAGNFWHPAIDFMLRTFEVSKATPTVARLFLGQRIECAECHNHPLENLTQDDFYGMAAFLARMKVKHGYGQYRRIWYNTREGEVLHPVTKQPVAPKFLGGERPAIPEGVDRREVLAEWITRDQKLQFARATVNRIWYEYFGRGIVEPFDDFRSTNRATHPELLDELAEYFIDSGFRFKALHRLILSSKTYQLSAHEAGRRGGQDRLEEILYARYVPRKLPAEVLLDAIVQVTEVQQQFRDYPEGTSPKELIASIGAPVFLTTFGFPRRDVMQTRSQQPSLGQALHLMNSEAVREKLTAEDNVLGRLLQENLDDGAVAEELYWRAYARPPGEDERALASNFLIAEQAAGRDRRRALENLLWAILNSKEFQLNR